MPRTDLNPVEKLCDVVQTRDSQHRCADDKFQIISNILLNPRHDELRPF